MMGGNTGPDLATNAGEGSADKKKPKSTKAMPVQDFLAGGSGPQLPRHKQVRWSHSCTPLWLPQHLVWRALAIRPCVLSAGERSPQAAVQDRKVKEKSKRALGQSAHSHWKSEAEMVLRQQYDS